MTLSATTKSGWIFLGFDPGIEFREDPDDNTKEQKREFVVYRRKMIGKGAVSFTEQNGDTATASTLLSDLSATDTGKAPSVPSGLTKMLCTRNYLKPTTQGSGIVEEHQEWTAYTDWVAWDAATELA